ncbi:DUF4351 domain-containing protein [Nocardia sp. NEAU-G5]|uniref:DUF4351 domain-containing protein n=1 Tax=Nocardia albiluteola TaxID=2842303 RepID=A0ABS6B6N3_9NOCA|nr:DUF4351 domain-containing protein [Nocardia albiluteola]MBU3065974.1 DUF4351 domain-containing protein [Nocardia albiluteola]
MTISWPRDPFLDGVKDEGRAEGEARALLRMLTNRGLAIPAAIRERIMSTTDIGQLDTWFDRACTAANLDEVFAD